MISLFKSGSETGISTDAETEKQFLDEEVGRE
jgi:hypothetical protein